jgi:hypothetical protein
MKASLKAILAVLAGLAAFYWVFWGMMRLFNPMALPIAAAIGRPGDDASVLLFGVVFLPSVASLIAGFTTAYVAREYPFVYSAVLALILLFRGVLFVASGNSDPGYTYGMLSISTLLSLPLLVAGTWLGRRMSRPRTWQHKLKTVSHLMNTH